MAWTQGTCLVKAARHWPGLEPPGSVTPKHSPTPSLVPVQLVRAVPGLLAMATGQAGQLDRFSSAQSQQRTRWHREVCSAAGPHQRTRAVSAGSCRCWRWAAAQGQGPHCGCRRQGTTPGNRAQGSLRAVLRGTNQFVGSIHRDVEEGSHPLLDRVVKLGTELLLQAGHGAAASGPQTSKECGKKDLVAQAEPRGGSKDRAQGIGESSLSGPLPACRVPSVP